MKKPTLRNQLDLALETILTKETEIRGLKMDKRHLDDKFTQAEKDLRSADQRVHSHEALLNELKNEIDIVTECIWPGFHPDKAQMMPAMGQPTGEREVLSEHEEAAHRMIRAIYRRCNWGLNPMMGYKAEAGHQY